MTTYAILVADVAKWSARTDLEELIPTFCLLFEARVNRELRVRRMETAFTGTIASSVVALPTGWLEFKRLWPDGYTDCPLVPQSLDDVYSSTEGIPTRYAVDGANVRFDGTGSVTGVYYKAIPALTSVDTTNWLCTNAYDAYLFGVLAEVADYMMDDNALAKHQAKSSAILEMIRADDVRVRGPLVATTRRGWY